MIRGEAIYIASRASIPERAARWRAYRDSGVLIVSSWIDESGEGETEDMSSLWMRIVDEVSQSERLVLYAEAGDFPLKGAFIEVGAKEEPIAHGERLLLGRVRNSVY